MHRVYQPGTVNEFTVSAGDGFVEIGSSSGITVRSASRIIRISLLAASKPTRRFQLCRYPALLPV